MKLLLDEMRPIADIGIIHVIHLGGRTYKRRRSYLSPQAAAKHYFEYCDMMTAAGYTIKSRIAKAWLFEVCLDDQIVETVEVEWPSTNWQSEVKLLEHKK